MATPKAPPPPSSPATSAPAPAGFDAWTALGYTAVAVSAVASGYHGYRRNADSAGWGLLWTLIGTVFPVVTPIVALAQGYAEPSDSVRLRRIEGVLHPALAEALGEHGA